MLVINSYHIQSCITSVCVVAQSGFHFALNITPDLAFRWLWLDFENYKRFKPVPVFSNRQQNGKLKALQFCFAHKTVSITVRIIVRVQVLKKMRENNKNYDGFQSCPWVEMDNTICKVSKILSVGLQKYIIAMGNTLNNCINIKYLSCCD